MQQSPYDPYNQPPSEQNTYYPPQSPTYIQPEQYQLSQWQQFYGQPQWQQPTIPPPPPKNRSGKWIVIACLIAFVIVTGGILSQGSISLPTSGTWTTTHSFTGSGIQQTAVFSASNDWKILWTCDPSSWTGGAYNVQVFVYGDVDDVAINTLCQSDNTSGETEEHVGGNIYLKINSEAAWTVQIQELK